MDKIYDTTLEIKFNESLSDSSIKMIKDILWNSLGFKTEIKRSDENVKYK